MKQLSLCTLVLLFNTACYSQTYEYRFNGSFNEATGGPVLSEVLSCGAAAGAFNTSLIPITAGSCGTTPQAVFDFNAGGGVSFPNANLIGGTYTVHIFWRFNALNGYRRIIDFLNGQTDVGLYVLNNCLNFYPNGNVGACPAFVSGNFYLLTLVRDGASNNITIYLNGTSFGTYNDAAANYVPVTNTTPIVFFRDNIASSAQCENADGSIKYLALSPQAATPAQVSTVFNNICTIVLPVGLTSFRGEKKGSGILLNWETETNLNNAVYNTERSADGSDFRDLAAIAATNTSSASYAFNDTKPLRGNNFYRLKITGVNGSASYSSVLKFNFTENTGFQLYPNPAAGNVTVSGTKKNHLLKLFDFTGHLLRTFAATGETMSISLESYPAGIYIVEDNNGTEATRQKLVKYQ